MALTNKIILSQREILYTALFGAIWGIVELSLGTSLHLMKIPFRGIILSTFAIIVLTSAKPFVPYKGSLVLIGAITATFKAMSIGFVITPVMAIFFEGLIAEIIFMAFRFNAISSIFTGISIMLYTLMHGLISQAFFFGLNIYRIYFETLSKTLNFINVSEDNLIWVLLL
ncbi:hypothetical protein ACFLSQ_09915, partial [Bacteroidota bacterium]